MPRDSLPHDYWLSFTIFCLNSEGLIDVRAGFGGQNFISIQPKARRMSARLNL